jgi:hypothetical protein
MPDAFARKIDGLVKGPSAALRFNPALFDKDFAFGNNEQRC